MIDFVEIFMWCFFTLRSFSGKILKAPTALYIVEKKWLQNTDLFNDYNAIIIFFFPKLTQICNVMQMVHTGYSTIAITTPYHLALWLCQLE